MMFNEKIEENYEEVKEEIAEIEEMNEEMSKENNKRIEFFEDFEGETKKCQTIAISGSFGVREECYF